MMTPYGHRTRKLPAPPHVVWDDLHDPAQSGSRAWLHLDDDEVRPRVLEAERPSRVVWSSLWRSRPDDQVAFELAWAGSETALTFTLLASGDFPDEDTTGRIRYRMNYLLWAELRESYG